MVPGYTGERQVSVRVPTSQNVPIPEYDEDDVQSAIHSST